MVFIYPHRFSRPQCTLRAYPPTAEKENEHLGSPGPKAAVSASGPRDRSQSHGATRVTRPRKRHRWAAGRRQSGFPVGFFGFPSRPPKKGILRKREKKLGSAIRQVRKWGYPPHLVSRGDVEFMSAFFWKKTNDVFIRANTHLRRLASD